MSFSLSTNDTVTGVSGGVLPKTCVPGRSAALMPEGTFVGVFGPGLDAAAAPDADARGAAITPTPSRIPAISRAFLKRIMSCAPSYEVVPRLVAVGRESRKIMPA